ncbi:MAG TPA: proline dehydrogenase family protein [Vicinamibacterales bacterium]|nr:proline dehydrogenase family protein [Vicinamibacterales bacterium]
MPLARNALLALSTNAWLRERATKTAFVRRAVKAFMPGERLDDAMAAAGTQQAQGIGTIFTRLGENVTRVEEAEEVTHHYLEVLDQVQAAGLRAQISVKPTQLGLDLDRELCLRNLQRLVERADARDNLVWIDMESSPYVDPTLDLFRRARARSPRVGIALQAYLFRTAKDVESLVPLGAAIRLVKGAYLEPASVAYPKKADVDENFYTLACRLLADDAQRAGGLLHIATHDPVLVDRLGVFIDQRSVPKGAYEYAMLYGIQRSLQQRLIASACPLRVLIAYGEYWFPWYMRRLAERPANVWFVVKSVLR